MRRSLTKTFSIQSSLNTLYNIQLIITTPTHTIATCSYKEISTRSSTLARQFNATHSFPQCQKTEKILCFRIKVKCIGMLFRISRNIMKVRVEKMIITSLNSPLRDLERILRPLKMKRVVSPPKMRSQPMVGQFRMSR